MLSRVIGHPVYNGECIGNHTEQSFLHHGIKSNELSVLLYILLYIDLVIILNNPSSPTVLRSRLKSIYSNTDKSLDRPVLLLPVSVLLMILNNPSSPTELRSRLKSSLHSELSSLSNVLLRFSLHSELTSLDSEL